MTVQRQMKIGNLCSKGHLLTEQTLGHYLVGGHTVSRCRTCSAEAMKKRRELRGEKRTRRIVNELTRFLDFVDKTETCWNWTGCLNENGYSMFYRTGSIYVSGHRYSFETYKGEIPSGMQIDHLCNNRKCVNPEHLEAVTARENTKRSYKRRSTQAMIARNNAIVEVTK